MLISGEIYHFNNLSMFNFPKQAPQYVDVIAIFPVAPSAMAINYVLVVYS